jgi:DHA3 family tetracycline resistance protein-like MFS transporter
MKGKFSPVHLYYGFSAATSMLFTMVFTISSLYYIETIGLTAMQLVLVGTVLETVYFLFEVPTGIVADVYSRRLSMVIGTFLTGIAFILEGSTPLFVFVLISQVLWGLGATFLSGATEAWIADFVDEDRLERVYLKAAQFSQFAALIGIFMSVLLGMYALQLPIVLAGVLFLFVGAAMVLLMPESSFEPLATREDHKWGAMFYTFSAGIHAVKKHRLLTLLFAVTFVTGLASEGFDRLWSAHFLSSFTFPVFSDQPSVLWLGLINASAMVLSILATHMLLRNNEGRSAMGSVKLLFFLHIGQILTVCLFARAGHFGIAFSAYLAVQTIRVVNSPINSALIVRNVHASIRSTVISTEGQVNAVGQIIGGPIVGWVASTISVSAGIFSTGIILLPAVFFLLIIMQYLREPERASLGLKHEV